MSDPDPRVVILPALRLRLERVTGDTLEGKARQRAELRDAIAAVESGHGMPDAARLRDLLGPSGHPEDTRLQEALASWDGLRE